MWIKQKGVKLNLTPKKIENTVVNVPSFVELIDLFESEFGYTE